MSNSDAKVTKTLNENINVPNRQSSKGKTSVHNSTTDIQLTENARKRKLAQSSVQSFRMQDIEYWQSKERLHRLRSETSMLRLQLKREQREAGTAHIDEKVFISFEKRQLALAEAEEKNAAKAAVQKISMARQNLIYPALRAKDEKPTVQSLSRDTKAFVTLVVNKLLRKESSGPRASNVQAAFKTDLCHRYNAVKANGPPLNQDPKRPYQNQHLWCPVMGTYFAYHEITATHIVPYSIGELTMEEIFGNGHTVWSNQNGLLLHTSIERLFDGGLITIVPASDDREEIGLKIRVLERNKDWLNTRVIKDSTLQMKDLHDRPLIFLNDHRPKRRYIYFMYMISLLSCEYNYRQEARTAELERSRRVFASLTPSLRASMVPAFATYIGHDIAPIFEEQERTAEEELAKNEREEIVRRYFECVKEMDSI